MLFRSSVLPHGGEIIGRSACLTVHIKVAGIHDGLGGAIYIKGDNNAVEDSLFDNNTAHNGSTIYTDGINFVINQGERNRRVLTVFLRSTRVWPHRLAA